MDLVPSAAAEQGLPSGAPEDAQEEPQLSFGEEAQALLEEIRRHQYTVNVLASKSHAKLGLVSAEDEAKINRDLKRARELVGSAEAAKHKALADELGTAAAKLDVLHQANRYLAGAAKSPRSVLEALDRCPPDAVKEEAWRALVVSHAAKVSYPQAVLALEKHWPDVREAIAVAPTLRVQSPLGTPPPLPANGASTKARRKSKTK